MAADAPRGNRRAAALGLSVTSLILFVVGCGDDGGGDQAAGTGPAAPGGAALYEEACASCHGTDLRGTDKGPSHLSQVYEPGHHSDDAFRAAIAQGSPAHHWEFGDMPPVTGLDADEVEAIIAFIREQQDAQGFEPYPPG